MPVRPVAAAGAVRGMFLLRRLGGIELLPDLPLDAIQIASAQDGLLSRFFVGQPHFALLAGLCVNSFD